MATNDKKEPEDKTAAVATPAQTVPRKIPGNLPYLTAHGALKKALERMAEAQRPDKFNADFLENVLKLTGGSARAIPPILKRMGFLTSEGSPTELYAKFKTDSSRGGAALQALKNGFQEIFRRSDYAHTADESKLRDIIVQITGLKANDSIVTAIKNTFLVVKAFAADVSEVSEPIASSDTSEDVAARRISASSESDTGRLGIGLSYNINIVLPEASDLIVLNAIFRSLKENLLQ